LPTLVETVEDAKSLLFRNYGKANSVKAGGHLQIKLFEEERWKPASFALMLQRPDRVRVRAYRPLAPTMFELVSDGQTCWLFVPPEKTAYLSEDCEAIHGGNENIAVSASAIVAAIVVVSDFDTLFSLPAHLYSEADLLRLVFMEETGAYEEIWINPRTGLATRQLLVGADGMLEADIAYKKHVSDGKASVPAEIEISLPRLRALMLLRIDDFQIDAKIPADAFDFSPPINTKILDTEGVRRD
jgi:outer membrane lipoprotein-sorting protein